MCVNMGYLGSPLLFLLLEVGDKILPRFLTTYLVYGSVEELEREEKKGTAPNDPTIALEKFQVSSLRSAASLARAMCRFIRPAVEATESVRILFLSLYFFSWEPF